MVDPINLNKVRKARAKADAAVDAAANRVKFGRSGAERRSDSLAEAKARARLEGHRREPGDPVD